MKPNVNYNSECQPRMMNERLTTSVAIIVGQFFASFDIFPGQQHQMRQSFVADNFRHKIAVARMIDQTPQFPSLFGGIDAVRAKLIN